MLHIGLLPLMFLVNCKPSISNGSLEFNKEEGLIGGILSRNSSETELTPKEYISWCEDDENNLINTRVINDFNFISFNKPVKYIALKELDEIQKEKESAFLSHLKDLGELDYFSFVISCKAFNDEILKYKLNSELDYYKRIEYFSFRIQKDFELVVKNDTIKPVLCHYERVYGLSSDATFLLAFPNKYFTAEKKLIYTDNVFGNGPIEIFYGAKTFQQIPKIKFYEKQN